MGKKAPAKGQHGLGARGQGKLLYFHTQIAQAESQARNELLRKRRPPQEVRQADGHWAR